MILMIAAQYIILTCWIIFLLYWFVSSLSVKPTQERNSGVGRFRWVIIGIVIAVLLFTKVFGLSIPFLTISLISHSELLSVASVILVIIGLVIALLARRMLAGNWSKDVDVKVDHELITSGIYRYVRHPIYTGVLLMGLGSVLLVGTTSVFLIFLAMLGFFWFKARREEILLTKHFPKEYPEYKKHTKALIPFIL
jgi:protein-S-isoprenylcysteine O-methyltransferase Ste14